MNAGARARALTVNLLTRAQQWREAEARARRFAHDHTDDASDATRMAEQCRSRHGIQPCMLQRGHRGRHEAASGDRW